jgi:hypothetical protein
VTFEPVVVLSTRLDGRLNKGKSKRNSGVSASEPVHRVVSPVALEAGLMRWKDEYLESGGTPASRPERSAAPRETNLIDLDASSIPTTDLNRRQGPQLAS